MPGRIRYLHLLRSRLITSPALRKYGIPPICWPKTLNSSSSSICSSFISSNEKTSSSLAGSTTREFIYSVVAVVAAASFPLPPFLLVVEGFLLGINFSKMLQAKGVPPT